MYGTFGAPQALSERGVIILSYNTDLIINFLYTDATTGL